MRGVPTLPWDILDTLRLHLKDKLRLAHHGLADPLQQGL